MATALMEAPDNLDEWVEKAEALEKLVTPPESEDELAKTDPDAVESRVQRRDVWYQEIEDTILDLSNTLPAGTQDYEARKLFEFMVELRRAIQADAEAADAEGHVLLATMKIADVARRLERRLQHTELESADRSVAFILETLRDAPATKLARLLDVSERTIGSWRRGGRIRSKKERAVLVAKLLMYLRASMTPTGLMMWFEAPIDHFGGRTPIEILDSGDEAAQLELVAFARGGRGQLAE
jgi:hypothetical protein